MPVLHLFVRTLCFLIARRSPRHRSTGVYAAAALFVLGASAGLSPDARAQSRIAVSAYAATTGIGGGVHVRALPRLHVRLAYTRLQARREFTYVESDVTLAADTRLRLGGTQGTVDWYPFGGDFRVSTGLMVGSPQLDGVVEAAEPLALSETKELSPERIGAVHARLSFQRAAPYVGVGWGNVFDDRWSFLFDLGAYYGGAPQVDVRARGLITPTSRQGPRAERALRTFRWYPNVSLGLAYRL